MAPLTVKGLIQHCLISSHCGGSPWWEQIVGLDKAGLDHPCKHLHLAKVHQLLNSVQCRFTDFTAILMYDITIARLTKQTPKQRGVYWQEFKVTRIAASDLMALGDTSGVSSFAQTTYPCIPFAHMPQTDLNLTSYPEEVSGHIYHWCRTCGNQGLSERWSCSA